jgi:hypothetical protein
MLVCASMFVNTASVSSSSSNSCESKVALFADNSDRMCVCSSR